MTRNMWVAGAALSGLALAAVAGCGSSSTSSTSNASHGAATTAPAPITITASEYSYSGAPSSLPSGITQFALSNAGAAPHQFAFRRLNDGVTVDQLMQVVRQQQGDKFEAMTAAYGGVDLKPSQTTSYAVDLKPGAYLLTSLSRGGSGGPGSSSGPPDIARGMLKTFTVTSPSSGATPPDAKGTIGMHDFGYDLPPSVGAGVYRVTNGGTQPHEIALARLDPGKTIDDLRAVLAGPANQQGPPPAWVHDEGAAVDEMAPGVTAWVPINLPPGHHVFLCFVTDPSNMKLHAEEGMIADVTVG